MVAYFEIAGITRRVLEYSLWNIREGLILLVYILIGILLLAIMVLLPYLLVRYLRKRRA